MMVQPLKYQDVEEISLFKFENTMKKYLFLLIFVCSQVVGQTITINNNTPNIACQASTIPVQFTTTGNFVSNTFTVEVIQKDIKSPGQPYLPSECYGTTVTTISSITTSANNINISLPNATTGFVSSVSCGSVFIPGIGYYPVYATTNRYFSIRVSNGTTQSVEYPVEILATSSCPNILSVQTQFTMLCAGSNGNVGNINFLTHDILPNNTYTVELSDIGGTFPAVPIIIGTASGNNLSTMPITIPANVVSGVYYLKLKSSSPISEKISRSFIIGISPRIGSSVSFCEGSPIAISYEEEYGYTYQWTKDNSPVQSIGVASFYKLNSTIADVGMYKLTVTSREGCSGTSNPITVNINSVPSVPTITQEINNSTSIKAIFTGSCPSGSTPHWYYLGGNVAGNPGNFIEIESNYLWDWVTNNGQTFTIPTVNPTPTFYASCRTSNYCESPKVTINLSIAPSPPTIAASSTQICLGETATLTANGCNNGIITWNDGTTGTPKVVNGGYWRATCTIDNEISNNSNIIYISVGRRLSLVITNPLAVSFPNTVDITAKELREGSTFELNETTFSYYADALATIPVSNPLAISTSGTYYIRAKTFQPYYPPACFDIKPVVVTINQIIPCPSTLSYQNLTDDFTSTPNPSLKKASVSITATNQITGNGTTVSYQAGNKVELNAGFKADNGTVFMAQIAGCN
jgi:hypothetical protein